MLRSIMPPTLFKCKGSHAPTSAVITLPRTPPAQISRERRRAYRFPPTSIASACVMNVWVGVGTPCFWPRRTTPPER